MKIYFQKTKKKKTKTDYQGILASVSACQSSVRSNTSYILNPGYPNAFNTPGTCTFYAHKSDANGK